MNVTHFDIAKNLPPGSDVNIDKTTETSYDKPGQFNLNGGIIPRQVNQLGDPMTVALKKDEDSIADFNVNPIFHDIGGGEYDIIFTEKLKWKKFSSLEWNLVPRQLVGGAQSTYMESKVLPWLSRESFLNNVNDSLYRSHVGGHIMTSVSSDERASDAYALTGQDPKHQSIKLFNRQTPYNPTGVYKEYILFNPTSSVKTAEFFLNYQYTESSKYNSGNDHTDNKLLDNFNVTDADAFSLSLGKITLQPSEAKRLSPVMHYDRNDQPLSNVLVYPQLKAISASDVLVNMVSTDSDIYILQMYFSYKIVDPDFTKINLLNHNTDAQSAYTSKYFNFQYNYTLPQIRFDDNKIVYTQDIRDGVNLELNETAQYRLNLSSNYEMMVSRASGVQGTAYMLDKNKALLDEKIIHLVKNFGAKFQVQKLGLLYLVKDINGALTEENGYHAGQVIVIDGTLLGGSSGTNDLTITLTNTNPPPATWTSDPGDGVLQLNNNIVSGTPANSNVYTINDISNLSVCFDEGQSYNDSYHIISLNKGSSKLIHTIKGTELGGAATVNDLDFDVDNESFSGTGATLLGKTPVGTPFETTVKRDLQSGMIMRKGDSDAIWNDLKYIMATVGNDFTGEQSSSSTTTQRGNYVVYIPVDKDDDQNYHDVMSNVGPLQIDNNNNRVKVDFKGVCYNPTTGEVEYVPLKNSNKRKRMMHVNAEMKME